VLPVSYYWVHRLRREPRAESQGAESQGAESQGDEGVAEPT